MADEETITKMLSSIRLGDGGSESESSSTKVGSGTGSVSGSGSGSGSVSRSGSGSISESGSGSYGSGSDDSTDSAHSGCIATCTIIQWEARNAFNDGRAAAIGNPNNNQNPNTTLYNNPLSILLTNFNEGWNDGVETAGPLDTVGLDDVVSFVRAAAYDTALMFDSLGDNSPKHLPTSEAVALFRVWRVAGFYVGRFLLEQYRYDKQSELLDFTHFFLRRRF